MSDYGDDYSDYGDEFYYVEDEYMMADDLAEHVIGSPPPVAYGDEDAIEDWDRFDYFNDLEYASDGYDDGKFAPEGTKAAKLGEKRKRDGSGDRGRKKQKMEGYRVPKPAVTPLPPVVWRTQAGRDRKTKIWDGNTESYALLKDWREQHADIPAWAAGLSHSEEDGIPSSRTSKVAGVPELLPPAPNYEDEDNFEDVEEDEEGEEDAGIDPTILLQALQGRLAEAGGPLAGMDPQQMLQFAMRMMSNQDAGDDIAGELADQLLGGPSKGGEDEDGDEDEDEDEEAPAGLLSWLDKQRASKQDGEAATPTSPTIGLTGKRPPTPPSSEANRSIRAAKETKETQDQVKGNSASAPQKGHSLEVSSTVTRKRKADDDVADVEDSTNATKRQATRSYDAPTTASQARAAPPPKATRSGRSKRL
jgi:hypothetical protein